METIIKIIKPKPLKVVSDTQFNDGHRVIVHEKGVIITKGIDTVFTLIKGKNILWKQ